MRQLFREQPKETQEIIVSGVRLMVPTEDFAALAERIGPVRVKQALNTLDQLYPQKSGESALQQLEVQLANPMPYDLDDTDLREYRKLHPKWHDWSSVKEICATIAVDLFKRL